jgi:PAS domain S-box-containing protein
METNKKSFLVRYGIAVLCAAAGLLLRSALTPLFGYESPFITLFAAIALSAFLGGFRAGILTIILSGLGANFFFMSAPLVFALTDPRHLTQVIVFFLMGSFISWIVSERRRIHLRLRASEQQTIESEKKLLLAQESTGVGIWEWDFKTNRIQWSEGIYKLLGLEVDSFELRAEKLGDFILPEDYERTMATINQSIAEGKSEVYYEFRIRHRDGKNRWLASKTQIVRGEDNQPVQMLGVNYDITERKETEFQIKNLYHELNRRLKELETIFDIAPVGIAVAQDPECNVIVANPTLARMVGVDAGENISSNELKLSYKHLRNGRELASYELPMQRAVAEKRTILNEEIDILRADGKLITIYGYAAPIFDEEGNVVSCVAAQIDISERKKNELERERKLDAEQSLRVEAEEANRLKDEFLATVSHELRTPLNAIIGWITMLRGGRLADEPHQRALEAIERSAKSQSQLIEDLLDVSRIISGKLKLKLKPVEPTSVINAALETIRPSAELKGLTLQARLSPQTGFISGDFDRLQQVVWNLLSNAVKFTPPGGSVEIALEPRDSQVEIIVSDTGRGISQDFLPFVFDRFRQADGSITRKYSGLGLGLAIVRYLVELHGGTVSVKSEGEDKGATFSVKLPVMSVLEADKAGPQTDLNDGFEIDYPLLENLRILIVDDEENTREILKIAFSNCRAVVETAASAAEALEKVKNWSPQVIVSDIGMPDEDGYSFIKKVRSWEKETSRQMIPSIALTAYVRPEDRAQALNSGFHLHVAKPVEPVELTILAENLINSKNQSA